MHIVLYHFKHNIYTVAVHDGQWRGPLMLQWSSPEQTVKQTIEAPVIWDAIALFMTPL